MTFTYDPKKFNAKMFFSGIRERIKYDKDFYDEFFTSEQKEIHKRIDSFFFEGNLVTLEDLVTDEALRVLFDQDYPCFTVDEYSEARFINNNELTRLPSIIAKLPHNLEYNVGRAQLDTFIKCKELSPEIIGLLTRNGLENPKLVDFEIFEFPRPSEIALHGNLIFYETTISNSEINNRFRKNIDDLFRSIEKIHIQLAAGIKDDKLLYFPIYFGFGTNSVWTMSDRSPNTGSPLRYYKQCLFNNYSENGFLEQYVLDKTSKTQIPTLTFKEFGNEAYVKALLTTKLKEIDGVPILRTGDDVLKLSSRLLKEYEIFADYYYSPDIFVENHDITKTARIAKRFGIERLPVRCKDHIIHDLAMLEPLAHERLRWGSILLASYLKTGKFEEIVSCAYNDKLYQLKI